MCSWGRQLVHMCSWALARVSSARGWAARVWGARVRDAAEVSVEGSVLGPTGVEGSCGGVPGGLRAGTGGPEGEAGVSELERRLAFCLQQYFKAWSDRNVLVSPSLS